VPAQVASRTRRPRVSTRLVAFQRRESCVVDRCRGIGNLDLWKV